MGRERKVQTGSSNLSARMDNSTLSTTASSLNDFPDNSTSKSKYISRTLTSKLLAPDLHHEKKSEKTITGPAKETATWKPAKVYERDFVTVHNDTFSDPLHRFDPLHPPKSTFEIAEEAVKKKEEKEAVDNLCKLVRTTYGTVATMLRSFNKKNTDNFTLYEFNEYMKRNNLETYLPESQQKLVFDYVTEKHNGSIPVKDFLKTVEEHEFHDHEYNKDAQKIRDFIAFHLAQKRAEQAAQTATGGKVIDTELEEAKKLKGIENEAAKIRQALGMKTYDLDMNHEEFNEVLEEVYFKKLPTNEAHRKYARFLHHSNLKLSQVPYYDIRSKDLDRLKHRSAMIDRILDSNEMKGRYLELKENRDAMLAYRPNNSALLSTHTISTLKSNQPVDTNNFDYDRYDEEASEIDAEAHSMSETGTVLSKPLGRPKTSDAAAVAVASKRDILDQSKATLLAGPKQSQFNDDKYTTSNNQAADNQVSVGDVAPVSSAPASGGGNMMLSKSLPNLHFSARPSPLAALDLAKGNQAGSNVNIVTTTTAAAATSGLPSLPKKKNKNVTDAVENSIINATQYHNVFPTNGGGGAVAPGGLGSSASVASFSPDRASGGQSVISLNTSLASQSNNTNNSNNTSNTSPAKKSKLRTSLLEPTNETSLKETDFYTQVYDESSSMGRLKDPSKIMRIEKIDPKVYAPKGKKIVHQARTTDWSRLGYVKNDSDAEIEDDTFTTTNSQFYPPLIYEPSQPVKRDLISEADRSFKEKEYKRQQRHARTQANLEITRQRLEYENIEKQMRALRRESSRIEDSIRYKTSIMLNDLYAFRSQPLQRMSKRQNIDLADRMWGGSIEKQTVQMVPDNRDFLTTYSSTHLKTASDVFGSSMSRVSLHHHHHHHSDSNEIGPLDGGSSQMLDNTQFKQ